MTPFHVAAAAAFAAGIGIGSALAGREAPTAQPQAQDHRAARSATSATSPSEPRHGGVFGLIAETLRQATEKGK